MRPDHLFSGFLSLALFLALPANASRALILSVRQRFIRFPPLPPSVLLKLPAAGRRKLNPPAAAADWHCFAPATEKKRPILPTLRGG